MVTLALAPIKIPYRILKYIIMTPIRLTIDFVDQLTEMTLKKLKMTKGDAKVLATKLAKAQLRRMRAGVIILTIVFAVWSVSLGFSATVYTGLYLFLIPQHSQEHFLYFNYVPVEQEQR